MTKSARSMKLILLAGVLTALLVTTAASSFGPSATTHNGVVWGYAEGKFISIRGFGKNLYDYNITPKTTILPADLASGLGAGAYVTVVGQCYTRAATSGCIALQIWIRLPAGGHAPK